MMADAGIVIFTVIVLIFLITLIIRTCWKLRDNYKHVKGHTKSQLDSSSTDCEQSQIASTSSCRPPRRHRSQRNTVVALCKTPGRIPLEGSLACTTEDILFTKINDELRYYQNKHPSSNIHLYLDKKFELSRKDDMAVMSHIQGNHAARYMTHNTKQALTRNKQLQRDIHTYHLTNPGIAESQLYWHMYVYYMTKGKPGKADSALQAAVSCMQHHTPNAWTAGVCQIQGQMYDRLAHVRPRHRSKYQDLALRCYTNAKEHCLYQPCQEGEDYLYSPIYYTLQTVFIKLDMPTLHTISDFSDTNIVYQRLSEFVVSVSQVTEAQDLLAALTPHIASLSSGRRDYLNERILICRTIVNIRLTQLAISDKAHDLALSFIKTAEDSYDDWSYCAITYKNARFNRISELPHNIKKILDSLFDRLILTNPPTPESEPLSDSVSSEPSDAPPSGLKQLTEESRRAEKQARRDAYQFSYSSGDIYTNSDADVPSDVN